MRKNQAYELFEQTLASTTDYNVETLIVLVHSLFDQTRNDERDDVLRTALNLSRVRSITGKRGVRRVSKANQILMRHASLEVEAESRYPKPEYNNIETVD